MTQQLLYKLGQNIKALRLAHKYTLRTLSIKVGVSFTTLNQWELGKKQPRINHLIRFCEIFNVKVEDLWK